MAVAAEGARPLGGVGSPHRRVVVQREGQVVLDQVLYGRRAGRACGSRGQVLVDQVLYGGWVERVCGARGQVVLDQVLWR